TPIPFSRRRQCSQELSFWFLPSSLPYRHKHSKLAVSKASRSHNRKFRGKRLGRLLVLPLFKRNSRSSPELAPSAKASLCSASSAPQMRHSATTMPKRHMLTPNALSRWRPATREDGSRWDTLAAFLVTSQIRRARI